ncbi:uncharacterized protein BJ171DRAFT_584207 [Polychytrium aggregatum]|uniref:uncharacterized protein n=1 Tax=Polychytrium aggregatum TaxID=110093 RepID=UPI0022FE7534|nr:uncharacterized protein BJ171DRAFT_584207 [Polychytrium aggregatum]KAI9202298.1 hypothetical protein BJ171DRAFT_584207 [Polychytrium aggregatum]
MSSASAGSHSPTDLPRNYLSDEPNAPPALSLGDAMLSPGEPSSDFSGTLEGSAPVEGHGGIDSKSGGLNPKTHPQGLSEPHEYRRYHPYAVSPPGPNAQTPPNYSMAGGYPSATRGLGSHHHSLAHSSSGEDDSDDDAMSSNGPNDTGATKTSEEFALDDKRQRRLVRNREAARRNRLKKKEWISNLKTHNEKMGEINQELKNRIMILQDELAHLKAILFNHGICNFE